jgi:hypothetical protein
MKGIARVKAPSCPLSCQNRPLNSLPASEEKPIEIAAVRLSVVVHSWQWEGVTQENVG